MRTVMHVITGLQEGGAEAVLYRVCLGAKNYKHVVVSLRDEGKYGPLLRSAGVSVYVLGAKPGRLPVGAIFRLWRLMGAIKPDVVQTWMYHADLIGGLGARLAGVRSVVWGIRNSDLEKGSSKPTTIGLTRILAWLSRWVPTYIAVCAQKARDVHAELGYRAGKMRVIPNGYDLEVFQPDLSGRLRFREALELDLRLPLLGSVGRYDPQKDYPNLLSALVRLREQGHVFRCLLVGSGLDTENDELMALIRSLDLESWVQVIGRQRDIPGVMNALDIHVLPSAYGEAFPNVVNEAMACGTPCVTTDVGDSAYIVGDTGWVVPRRDSVALAYGLATAIREMQTSAWVARQEACRRRIETEFSLEKMIRGYDVLWREAIGTH